MEPCTKRTKVDSCLSYILDKSLTLEKKGRSCLDKFLHGLMMETNDKKVRAPTRQSTELGESVEESLHGNMEALAIQSIYFDTGSVQHFVKTNNFCC